MTHESVFALVSEAAVINCHIPGGLKHLRCIILSQFWSPEVQNPGVGKVVPSGGAEEDCTVPLLAPGGRPKPSVPSQSVLSVSLHTSSS